MAANLWLVLFLSFILAVRSDRQQRDDSAFNFLGVSLSKETLESLLANIQDVSPLCRKSVMRFISGVKSKDPNAIQMLDAFGKIPSNLKKGHLQWFGSYPECKSVANNTANYCLVRLGKSDELTAVQQSPALGTCFPSVCSDSDVESLLNTLLGIIKKSHLIPGDFLDGLSARKTICDVDQPWETGAYITIALLGLFFVVCTFGTIVECCHPRWERIRTRLEIRERTVSGEDELLIHTELTNEVIEEPKMSPVAAGFVKFSFYRNWKFLTEKSRFELSFLNGMRVATIWWVILGEQFNLGQIIYENPFDYMDGMKTFLGQLVANSNLAADTFFILSGLVLTFTMLKKSEEKEPRKRSWISGYVRRWWRITPLYAILILVFLYVVPHVVTGPFPLMVGQDIGGNPIDQCKQYWWTNLLYINNFVPSDKTQVCLDWTWFLALEMQFFLLTPPLVSLLHKFPKTGVSIISILIAGVLITNAVLESHFGLPIAMFQEPIKNATETGFNPNVDYVFTKPYTRASPYLLGMLLGFLFARKPHWKFPWPKLDLVFNVGCWLSSCIVANRVIFGLFDHAYDSPTAVDMVGRVCWQMLSRFGFSAAVCWVIFACYYDYAGPIRNILEWNVWRPLSHLTYAVYLFHPAILQLYLINQRDPLYFNPVNMTLIFFGELVANYFLAFVLAIVIEIPLLRLEREVVDL